MLFVFALSCLSKPCLVVNSTVTSRHRSEYTDQSIHTSNTSTYRPTRRCDRVTTTNRTAQSDATNAILNKVINLSTACQQTHQHINIPLNPNAGGRCLFEQTHQPLNTTPRTHQHVMNIPTRWSDGVTTTNRLAHQTHQHVNIPLDPTQEMTHGALIGSVCAALPRFFMQWGSLPAGAGCFVAIFLVVRYTSDINFSPVLAICIFNVT